MFYLGRVWFLWSRGYDYCIHLYCCIITYYLFVGLDGFGYQWSCASYYDASKPCTGVTAPTGPTFSFAANLLGAGKHTVGPSCVRIIESFRVSVSMDRNPGDVAILAISIEPLQSTPVNPSKSLTITGVLNQQGVSLAEVAWQWSLQSGVLAHPNMSYLSSLDARVLVIGTNVLTPGI